MINKCMKLSNRQLARNLYRALQEVKESEHSQVLKNFVQMLYKMRKFSQADRVIEEYINYEKEMKGETALTVTTAHKITAELKKLLETKFGTQTTITETVDENILGGIIIQSKNTIYDASIKSSIEQLKNTL